MNEKLVGKALQILENQGWTLRYTSWSCPSRICQTKVLVEPSGGLPVCGSCGEVMQKGEEVLPVKMFFRFLVEKLKPNGISRKTSKELVKFMDVAGIDVGRDQNELEESAEMVWLAFKEAAKNE